MLFFIKIHLKARKHCETFLSGHFMKHPSKHLLVLKTSWRHLEDVLKTSCKTKNRYAKDVLKKCLEDFLKICLEDVLKTCLEDIFKTLWRKAKYLLGISVPNKSKCVSNKSIFNKSTCDNSKANPKCIK